jgi:hypothetical protein
MRRTSTSANTELAAKLAAATGLDVRITETGGGCTALMATLPGQWNDPDAANVLITAAQDPSFPLHVADEGTGDGYAWGIHVGAYAAGAAFDKPETLLDLDSADTYLNGEDSDPADIAAATERTTLRVVAALVRWQVRQEAAPAPTQLAGE